MQCRSSGIEDRTILSATTDEDPRRSMHLEGDTMKRSVFLGLSLIVIAFSATGFLFSPSHAYNKSWDQGHIGTDPLDPKNAEKPPGPPCTLCNCYGSPVSCSEGNYVFNATDLRIPGNIPLEVTRTYNSKDNIRTGYFGYGWSAGFEMRLVYLSETTGNTAKILMPNGQRYDFTEMTDGTFTPPLGVHMSLTVSTDGIWTLSRPDTSRYEFNTEGRLIGIMDRNNNRITIHYTDGSPDTLSDDAGRTISIVKGPNGKIAAISDFTGRTVSYGYDLNGNLTSVTDPMGNTTTYYYGYGSEHNLQTVKDSRGYTVVSITYTISGKVEWIKDSDGVYKYTYLDSTQTTKMAWSIWGTWTYTYDGKGVVSSIQDPLGFIKSRVYDTDYNLIKETDGAGNATSYSYDTLGNLLTRTDPLGNTTSFSYVERTNWLASRTDPLGSVTRYEYDTHGNPVKVVRACYAL